MNFDMNRTWSQATAMVTANWQFLGLIAGIFFLLPSLLMYVGMPDVLSTMISPSEDPDVVLAQLADLAGPLAFIILFSTLFSVAGYGAMISLLGADRPTVGEALRSTLRAMPTLLGCMLVAIIGYVVLVVALVLVAGLVTVVLSFLIGEIAASFLMVIGLMIALAFLVVRFVLVGAVVMFEGLGPIAAFKRSWSLTKANHKQIFLFFVLITVVYMVVSMMVLGVLSVLLSFAGGLFALGLVNSLMGMAVAMVLTGIVVSTYNQATGATQNVADIFD